MANDPNCTTILCVSPATFTDPGSLTVAVNPTGSGGQALNLNFQTLQYRQPQCDYQNYEDPAQDDDVSINFCRGSRWLNTRAGGGAAQAMWICTSNTASAAAWSPWAFWVNPDQWAGGTADNGPLGASVQQDQSLAYANAHFSIEGEYRSIYFSNPNVGSPLVLVPQHTDMSNGAVILGIYANVPGGNTRGASAVDFQNLRADDAQVASGDNSFIAGGQNNTASGDFSHAQGIYSQASGDASHAEGSCDASSTKSASDTGAHVEGIAANNGSLTACGPGAHAGGESDQGN